MCVLPRSTRTHARTHAHAHIHTQDRGQIAEWLPLAFGLHQTSVKAAGGHFPATGGEVRFISWPQCSRSPESHPVGRAPPAGSPGEERIWCASMLGTVRRIRGSEAARRGAVRWPCPLPPHVPFHWGSAAAATMAPAHRALASRAVRLCLRGLRVFGISVLHTNTKGIFVFLKTGST